MQGHRPSSGVKSKTRIQTSLRDTLRLQAYTPALTAISTGHYNGQQPTPSLVAISTGHYKGQQPDADLTAINKGHHREQQPASALTTMSYRDHSGQQYGQHPTTVRAAISSRDMQGQHPAPALNATIYGHNSYSYQLWAALWEAPCHSPYNYQQEASHHTEL